MNLSLCCSQAIQKLDSRQPDPLGASYGILLPKSTAPENSGILCFHSVKVKKCGATRLLALPRAIHLPIWTVSPVLLKLSPRLHLFPTSG